jgi:putative MATE family efflux protein
MMIQTAYTLINGMFLGRLKEGAAPALAAIGVGGSALMVQFSLIVGLSVGTSALVARSLGAGQHEDAQEATRQSLILSVIGGALTAVPLVLFAVPIVAGIGAKGDVVPLAADYLAIIACFSIPMFLLMIVTSALRSAGDVRSPLYAGLIMTALNVALDRVLILGLGPFPSMGVHGAAIATGISRLIGTILIFWFLRRSVLAGSLAHMRVNWEWFGRILNVGWPALLANLLWTTALTGYIRVLAALPDATAAQGALTAASRIEAFAFMPGLAYSAAATPLVGQNLGAGKPERAMHTAWVATAQAAAIMSAVAVLFLTIPRPLSLLVTTEESVVRLMVSYLIINAFSEPFLALGMVLRGALQGAGETRIPALVTFVTNWLIRVPLAWLLAVVCGYGAAGAWVAMSGTTILSGILIAAWFKWGNWRAVQI